MNVDGLGVCDKILPEFGFIATERNVYNLRSDVFAITVVDSLSTKDNAGIHISYGEKTIFLGFVWYLHELQNAIFQSCRFEIQNELMRKVLINKTSKWS